jgi:septal ring factor EnvC (AmiA/AmiB activator)
MQQLREKTELLERKLIFVQTENKVVSEAAQEYENELNELRKEFNSQSKQLKESSDQNTELLNELRQQKDEIDQLAFDVGVPSQPFI